MYLNSDCIFKFVKFNDVLYVIDMFKNNLLSCKWLFKFVKISCWFISDIVIYVSVYWNNILFGK